MGGDRPRIKRVKESDTGTLATDTLAFGKNLSSENARHISTFVENVELDIWFDKHYFHRFNHGDENGERKGIDFDNVKELIEMSFRHLLFYGSKVKGFHFLNNKSNPQERSIRIVLQDTYSERSVDDMLNIIVEFHLINFNKYEITVITAMSCHDFKMSEGQFALEIKGKTDSILKQNIGKQLKELDYFE